MKDREPRPLSDAARRALEEKKEELLGQQSEARNAMRKIVEDAGGDAYHDNVFLDTQARQMTIERELSWVQTQLEARGVFDKPEGLDSVQIGHRVRVVLDSGEGREEVEVLILDRSNANALRNSPEYRDRNVEVVSDESDLGRALLNARSGSQVDYGKGRSARILGIHEEDL